MIDDVEIWTRNGYVNSMEEYQEITNNLSIKKSRISAIVRSILSDDQKNIFKKYGYIFGCNEKPTNETCGRIIGKVMCSVDKSHTSYYKHERCNDPLCPVCYPKFTHVIADHVTNRVVGYNTVYKRDPLYHLIFWPDILTGYENITDAMRDANKMLKALGAKMALVLYHPYRIPEEMQEQLNEYKYANKLPENTGFWKMAHDDVLKLGSLAAYIVYGPHFHAIASGYLMDTVEYSNLGIGGYKKVRYMKDDKDVETLVNYIATHACKEHGKQTVRYFGLISPSKLGHGLPKNKKVKVLCQDCNASLEEYYCMVDPDGVPRVMDLKHKEVTRVVMTYVYYKITGKKRLPKPKSRVWT